jgi:16S rRNA (uracil1498-N3)-methyltransferase
MIEGLLHDDGGVRMLMRLEKKDGRCCLRSLDQMESERPGARIELLIGLLKSDQFDAVLRAASELGVSRIHPILCERSVPRIGDTDLPKKMARWQRILDEGSKISGFAVPARIAPPSELDCLEWSSVPEERYAAMLFPQALSISNVSVKGDVAFAVGPEGDWTDGEVRVLLRNNFVPVNLGRGILRSSTAAIVGCGWFLLSCAA